MSFAYDYILDLICSDLQSVQRLKFRANSEKYEEMTPEPDFVQPAPYGVDLEPGKDYWFCSCGK